jgi:hypothetical protein
MIFQMLFWRISNANCVNLCTLLTLRIYPLQSSPLSPKAFVLTLIPCVAKALCGVERVEGRQDWISAVCCCGVCLVYRCEDGRSPTVKCKYAYRGTIRAMEPLRKLTAWSHRSQQCDFDTTWVAQLKMPSSIHGVSGLLGWPDPYIRTLVLGSTQPLKGLTASKGCPAHAADRASTSQNPVGLHALLRGWLYVLISRWCLYLTGNTRIDLQDLL